MTRLVELYHQQDQSPWLDNIKRDWISNGELERWIRRGVRGLTSNPTIFQQAIQSSDAYDGQLRELIGAGRSVEQSYWEMVTTDIRDASALLRPIHEASGGLDGHVSIEVDPAIARDTEATIVAAHDLNASVAEPNLLVKIPSTVEGLPAIRQLVSEGLSINCTLLFSVRRYGEVIDAYIEGLEACSGDLSRVASVASFFVSRVDTDCDRRLDRIPAPRAAALRGRAAVANAQLAYRTFLEKFSGPRWESLARRGARVQRPLWASTSTKDPAYCPTLYVDPLIGPQSVNTMPEVTLEAFETGGRVQRTVDADFSAAESALEELATLGIDLDEVTRRLEEEGVEKFSASHQELLATLEGKAAALAA